MKKTIKRPKKLTPMFRQYFDLKERYPESLLLFRCGDFYELYGEDAIRGAKAMEIALTYREIKKGHRIEMAGVPHHALDNYMKLLIKKGIKVAVCEQLEDPKKSKGLVKRDVTRVITSGTVMDPGMLPEDENNYLIALATFDEKTGIAVSDVSTGELRITNLPAKDVGRLKDEIYRIRPSEVILNSNLGGLQLIEAFLSEMEIPRVISDEPLHGEIFHEVLKGTFDQQTLSEIDWDRHPEMGMSAAALVNYLNQTQKTSKHSLHKIDTYNLADYMILDATTWRNLELSHTIIERKKKGSLLWILDRTLTGMGARLLRSWLERPLIEPVKIRARLDAVEEMVNNFTLHAKIRQVLDSIYDLERITTRVIYGNANARDLLSLRNSIKKLPDLKKLLNEAESSLLCTLRESLDTLEDVYNLIYKSISEDPPISVKEGGIIKDGYNLQLDELREIRKNARQWISQLEQKEREKTGIKSLKVKFNQVFGYFIEVTRPNLHLVPDDYVRKQTIANGERFFSAELKEYEDKVLGSEERIVDLEYKFFVEIRDKVARQSERIQAASRIIANIDVLASLAEVAMKEKYCKPEVVDDDVIEIKGGRHPVVEKFLKDGFVPNDTRIGDEDSRFHVITGPNMSGKSTYLRQIGLICIMAQLGSFVPADSARIGIVDRVFTRVGASDDLHLGKSTFLVEMNETANIIKNASRRSLVLLDEIGRGTSTYDGMSIAWSVSEYICRWIGARTLFATHFHQLTELAEVMKGVKNFRVDVKETNREIIFLHRIVPGGTDKSYGIYVARLAGLPPAILTRAREILDRLESTHQPMVVVDQGEKPAYQLTFFDLLQSPMLEEIRKINPDELSPRQALEKIYQWKENLD